MISARGFKGAVSFLTRIPLRTGTTSKPEVATWVPFFPVVGALVGVCTALVYVGARELWSSTVAATIAVAVEVVITGGLHEDGLGDTADALGGAGDPVDARRILKDPRLGTFGVLAVLLAVLLRVGTIASLDAWSAVAVLPAAHALGRAAATSALGYLPPAAEEGLGATYARTVTKRSLVAGAAAALCIAALAIGAWALPAAIGCAGVAWRVGFAARRRIGGATGDLLGAIQQCALVVVLLVATLVERQAWLPLTWWR